jgi:hypothetical protein
MQFYWSMNSEKITQLLKVTNKQSQKYSKSKMLYAAFITSGAGSAYSSAAFITSGTGSAYSSAAFMLRLIIAGY